MEIQIALIVAVSTIIASIVHQILNYFSNKDQFKRDLRKEYKNKKITAYIELSKLICNMWHTQTT